MVSKHIIHLIQEIKVFKLMKVIVLRKHFNYFYIFTRKVLDGAEIITSDNKPEQITAVKIETMRIIHDQMGKEVCV